MKKRIVVILIALMVVCSFAPTYASSLWQKNETVQADITACIDGGNFNGLVTRVNIYTLYNSDDSSLAGSIGFFLTNILYGITNFFGELSLQITNFAKSFNIYEYASDELDTVFGEMNDYFVGNSFIDGNGIMGLAIILAALLGIISLVRGKASEGISRVGKILLICLIAFLLYSNTTETLTKARGITDDINAEIETSLSNGSDIYSQMADILIVKPYNQAQYGESDPLDANTGLMKDYPTLYQYFITTGTPSQPLWFGHGAGKTVAGASYSIDRTDHKKALVSEDIAGENGWNAAGVVGGNTNIEGETKRIIKYDDPDFNFDSISKNNMLNKEGRNIGTHFANDSHWFGVAGEMFITMFLTGAAMLIFIGLAIIDIIGQLLVLMMLFMGIPVILWALFKGFEPIMKAAVLFVMGFSLSIISTVVRSAILLMLSVFDTMTGGNMVLQLLLIVVLVIMLKLFGWQIVDIFGVTPQFRQAVRGARQLKRIRKELKKNKKGRSRRSRRNRNNDDYDDYDDYDDDYEDNGYEGDENNGGYEEEVGGGIDPIENNRNDTPPRPPWYILREPIAEDPIENNENDTPPRPLWPRPWDEPITPRPDLGDIPEGLEEPITEEPIRDTIPRESEVEETEYPKPPEDNTEEAPRETLEEEEIELPRDTEIEQREIEEEPDEINRGTRTEEIETHIPNNVHVRENEEIGDDRHISDGIADNTREIEMPKETKNINVDRNVERNETENIREHTTNTENVEETIRNVEGRTVIEEREVNNEHVTNTTENNTTRENRDVNEERIINKDHTVTEHHNENRTVNEEYTVNEHHNENRTINENRTVTEKRVINENHISNETVNRTNDTPRRESIIRDSNISWESFTPKGDEDA